MNSRHLRSIRNAALASAAVIAASPALAADVTSERLINADRSRTTG